MPVLHTRLFAALVLAVLLARASGDATAGKVAWLIKNAIALQSVDPKDDDFADLRPLRQSIGNCRIVMLGGRTILPSLQRQIPPGPIPPRRAGFRRAGSGRHFV